MENVDMLKYGSEDEAHVIEKTLENMCKYIPFSYWVISDTGSTDDTKPNN